MHGCVCPGDNLIFSCTAVATTDDVTIWKGTAIDCQYGHSIIALIHRCFMSPGGTSRSRDCNDGAIVA